MIEVLYNISVFFIILMIAFFFGCFFKLKQSIVIKLFLWHTLFSVAYYYYSFAFLADATKYYEFSLQENLAVNFGTEFVIYFTSFFSKILYFSYFSCFLIFNLIGTIGLFALASVLLQLTKYHHRNNKWVFLFLFLPSLSYWSSGIGKDAFSFLAICLSIWAVSDGPKYIPFSLSVIIMLLVRPHMAGMMVIGMLISIVVSKEQKMLTRVLLGSIALALAGVMIPFALQYAGLKGNVDVGKVTDYIETRQSFNTKGESSFNISEMSFPMQLITYVFRPLPFEAHSVFALLTSLENSFLLWIAIKVVVLRKNKRRVKLINYNKTYFIAYLLISWSVLAVTTPNLGIASRQKWMFVPVLYVILLNAFMSKKRINDATT